MLSEKALVFTQRTSQILTVHLQFILLTWNAPSKLQNPGTQTNPLKLHRFPCPEGFPGKAQRSLASVFTHIKPLQAILF